MIHVAVPPRRAVVRWVLTRHTAYLGVAAPLLHKDFSALPVCGSMRPSASQRELGRRA